MEQHDPTKTSFEIESTSEDHVDSVLAHDMASKELTTTTTAALAFDPSKSLTKTCSRSCHRISVYGLGNLVFSKAEFLFSEGQGGHFGRFSCEWTIPGMLHASHESCTEALKVYRPVLGPVLVGETPVFMNFDNDMLHIRDLCRGFRAIFLGNRSEKG